MVQPNYVLYTYLVRTASTNKALMDKCLKQLTVGCEGIIDKYRCDDGGFGAWGRGESTLFHTGLILALLGLASTVVAIDQTVLDAATCLLESRASTSGEMKPHTKHWPEARWDSITATAHVFNSMCLGGCACCGLAFLRGLRCVCVCVVYCLLAYLAFRLVVTACQARPPRCWAG